MKRSAEFSAAAFSQIQTGAQGAIFFSMLQVPVRIKLDENALAEFGSFEFLLPPMSQDEVFVLPPLDNKNKFTIEWLETSIRGNNATFMKFSRVLETKNARLFKFLKEFVSSFALIGIGVTLGLLGTILVCFGAAFRFAKRPLILFGLSIVGQGWVALYFSRIFFEVPTLNGLHVVPFCIYLLSCAFYFFYFSWKSTLVKILRICGSFSFLGAIVVGVWGARSSIVETVAVYKWILLVNLIGWVLVPIAIMTDIFKDAKTGTKPRGFDIVLVATSFLVAFGQINDVLRVFSEVIFPYNIGPFLFFSAALMAIVGATNDFIMRYQNIVAQERKIALSDLITSISHDIRKPFSLMKIIMNEVRSISDSDELRSFAQESLPEVDRAIQSVEGMLSDVLQINSNALSLVHENSNFYGLLDGCYLEIFRSNPGANVTIENDILSTLALRVDVAKVSRIFLNIIGNACQAMNWNGKIWVTAFIQNGRARIAVGNSGSFIPEEIRSKIFDSFFTSNKKGGTGLGLAIAQKWVRAHGGSILCHSEKNEKFPTGMVEFRFDLPIASEQTELGEKINKLNHSTAYKLDFKIKEEMPYALNELLHEELRSVLRNKHLQIVTVDDEHLYLDGIESSVKKLNFGNSLKLEKHSFLRDLNEKPADLYVIDYDLGNVKINGLGLPLDFRTLRTYNG